MLMYVPNHKFTIKSINSLFLRDYKEDNFFAGERHDFWEMVYVEKGTLTVSEDEKIYDLSAGQVIFHAPMEFHKFWAKKTSPSRFRIISFNLETTIKHNLSKGVFTLNGDLEKQLVDTYEQIFRGYDGTGDIKKKDESDPVEETLAIKKLETFLLSLLSEEAPDKTQQLSLTARRYKEIVNFMNTKLYENLSMDDIANEFHLSTSYLKKLFRTYAGCGVMHYFTKMKITQSLYHLKKGESIKEISEILSFSSPNYFTAVFKKEMGILPTKYRTKK